MNLLILFSLSVFIGLASGIQTLDGKILVVERRTQASGAYGGSSKYGSGPASDYSSKTNTHYKRSPTSYGSGVESKYCTKMGSYKGSLHFKKGYNSATHGSGAMHGSYNHGSASIHNSYKHGSGATHKSDSKYGSYKHGSYNHGSTAVHGSGATHKSDSKYGSYKHGSNAVHGSSTHGSKHGSGSIFYSSKYIWHSSGAIGSNTRHGSSKMYSQPAMSGINGGGGSKSGSGAKGGSGAKSSYRPYNLFAPTMMPTEALPPIWTPPPPTNFPTDTTNIPKIPLSFDKPTSGGIEVPQIPLSFQIQQGANGWSQYPDSPPVTNAITIVAAKIAGVAESAVTNMKIARKNRRSLSTAVTITYDITTTPESVGQKTQETTYDMLINKLQLAVKSNNFSMDLHKMGVLMNISSISFSEYTVFYPTMTPTIQQNVLTSGGATNNTNTTESLIIGIGLLLVLFTMGAFGVLLYRRHISKVNKKEVEIEPRPEVSMVERPVSLARVSNPMIDVIPNQINRISFDHTIYPHNE